MRISKNDLCSDCLGIHPIMSDGKPSQHSIADLLDGEGYKNPMGYVLVNQGIKLYLEKNGGCSNCRKVMQRATS